MTVSSCDLYKASFAGLAFDSIKYMFPCRSRPKSIIIVQIPIRVIHPEDLIHEERWDSETLDGLQVVNKARVENIRGVGCVIIQIPILFFNIRIDDEKFRFKYVRLKNLSHVDIMRGSNNVLIQMPLFIIVNSLADPSRPMVHTTIHNTVTHQLMSGENNILIQMPVQFVPDN